MRSIILKIIGNNTWSGRLLANLNLIRRLLLCPYVKLSFIPFRSIISILNTTPGRFESIILTDTGVLILFYSVCVVKIPLGPIPLKDLKRNMNQYNLIKASERKALVNYWLEDHGTYFKMQLLLEGNNKRTLAIQYFKTINKEPCTSLRSQKDIYELILLGRQKFIDVTAVQLSIDEDKKYPMSIMHGDLTSRNIMTDTTGGPLLIDLNRFKFKGFEFIDRVHFEVDFESKKIQKNYFDYIILNFDWLRKIYGSEALKIYVLYRIGSEHNNGIKNEGWYYDGMRSLAQKLDSKMTVETTFINER